MSIVKIQGNASGTGTLTIAAPNTNSDRTLTLPDNTGTVVTTGSTAGVSQAMLASGVAGTGPAFSAYQSSAQTLSSGTWTKLQFQTEEWDTASAFDSTTNYRFQPQVAGYYMFAGGFQVSTTQTTCLLSLYKNGSNYKSVAYIYYNQSGAYGGGQMVYLNGSTDYVELYGYIALGQALSASNSASTFFQGAMVRAA